MGLKRHSEKNSVNFKVNELLKEHPELTATVTQNGWMNEERFIEWILRHLPAPKRIGWFIIDLYSAHRTPAVIEAIKSRGYIPIFIPGGCTSKLQFHDVYVNKTFKEEVLKHVQMSRIDIIDQMDWTNKEDVKRIAELKPSRETLLKAVAAAEETLLPCVLVEGISKLVLPRAVWSGPKVKMGTISTPEVSAEVSADHNEILKGVFKLIEQAEDKIARREAIARGEVEATTVSDDDEDGDADLTEIIALDSHPVMKRVEVVIDGDYEVIHDDDEYVVVDDDDEDEDDVDIIEWVGSDAENEIDDDDDEATTDSQVKTVGTKRRRSE